MSTDETSGEWWTDMRQLDAAARAEADTPASNGYYPPDRDGSTGYYPRREEPGWALWGTVALALLCVAVMASAVVGAMHGWFR